MLLTLLFATVFALILRRTKMPAALMMGALLGSLIYNLISNAAHMDGITKTIAQVIAGAYIGSKVSKAEILQMKNIYKPALIVLPCLFVINVLSALLMKYIGGVDLLSAMFAAAPGGLSDMPIIAVELGADVTKVSALQLVRFLASLGVFPLIINYLGKKYDPDAKSSFEDSVKSSNKEKRKTLPFVICLSVALAFGLLGKVSGMAGGTMAFAIIGTIVLKNFYSESYVPDYVRKTAQILAGAYVGSQMGANEILGLLSLWKSALILIFCYFTGAIIMAIILKKFKYFGFKEGLLAATPAGASDMALISRDLGIFNPNLIILQVLRLIAVISIFPSLLMLVNQLFR